ncbi:MAG: hypothetical protein ABR530_03465 [Pyrinomonadaceae bacterium]
MKKLILITLIVLLGLTSLNASAQKPADYKITQIKILPFIESRGVFEDEITAADPRSFFNDLDTSLFVTVAISGPPGEFVVGRKVRINVTEGKRIKFSKTEQVGLIGEGGKYHVPVYLYGSMCDTVTITASLLGQKTASKMTRKVEFQCGE